MSWFTLMNFTPLVIILLVIMATMFIVILFSESLSERLARKYEGDYTNIIKIIAMVILALCSFIIVLSL